VNPLDLPVAAIWARDPALVDDAAKMLTDGRAPVGFGLLLARYCEDAQIDVRVALALALHETGNFKYGGTDPVFSANPSFNNFGGLKTTDGFATFRFLTVPLGVLGLVGHLAWYAYPAHSAYFCSMMYDPRHFSWGHKAQLRTVRDFGNGVWNTGNTYATAMERHLTRVLELLP